MKVSYLMPLAAVAMLTACGFHLRGQGGSYTLPYQSMAVEGAGAIVSGLQQYLRAVPNMKLVPAADAEATVSIVNERTEKVIRSLNQSGNVSEYELRYTLTYTLLGSKRQQLFPVTDINIRRYMTYSDSLALAKEQEEAMLIRDMQQDATQQVIRRLSVFRPKPEDMSSQLPAKAS
ncbi:LPS assembly lipoprotein LptE [Chitinivorax sp. B]|uniref:LPS-assembly lipoprotein LptE n=1 Tax=Chitinivorax sp. B TaxID=2502235 RepID=UPI0010F81BFA|nr:LPS assembly lipoprotein LptE [Chitinivorax sp. B]